MIRRSIAILPLLIAALGCESGGEAAKKSGGGSEASGFSGSECQACLREACSGELDECASDPECGRYWTCLGDCDLNDLGGPDETCEARCLDAAGATLGDVRLQTSACLWSGAGASCGACGTISAPDVTRITTQMCPDSPETKPCYKCEDERCCETYAACASNPECGALKQCVSDCASGDYACAMACDEAHPDGVGDWGARYACVWLNCANEVCFTPPDGPFVPNPCLDCVREGCGDLYVACQAEPDCYRLGDCVAVCDTGDGDCIQGCRDEYPDAAPTFDAFAVCGIHRCAIECG